MSNELTRDDLIIGALHCAVHASDLISGAAILLHAGRASSSFLLAVAAREELGKHYILLEQADLAIGVGTVAIVSIQGAIRPRKNPHQPKLDAGQSTFEISAPLPVETFVEHQATLRRMANERASSLHSERLAAQYVDLTDEGSWALPAGVSLETAHRLIQEVKHEVADPLRWVLDEPEARKLSISLAVPMPSADEFLGVIESLVHSEIIGPKQNAETAVSRVGDTRAAAL